jgi:hypothetical protein
MCPVTRTIFLGNVEAVVLRPTCVLAAALPAALASRPARRMWFWAWGCSGRVVTMDCVKKLVLPDMKDPISGEPLTKEDLIPLKLKASGFAGSHQQLVAVKVTAMQTVT